MNMKEKYTDGGITPRPCAPASHRSLRNFLSPNARNPAISRLFPLSNCKLQVQAGSGNDQGARLQLCPVPIGSKSGTVWHIIQLEFAGHFVENKQLT